MTRLSAEEFSRKTPKQRDWTIYDSLMKGQDTMKGLRTDVDAFGEKLAEHCDNPGAHTSPKKESNSRVAEHKWKIALGMVGLATLIVTYMIGS